jgi:hypothetical protein
MRTSRAIKQIIAAPLLSGALTVAGLSMAAGTAQAQPAGCDVPYGCWCPGQALPKTNGPLPWDMNSCHNYHYSVLGGHGYLIPPPPGYCPPAPFSDFLYDKC